MQIFDLPTWRILLTLNWEILNSVVFVKNLKKISQPCASVDILGQIKETEISKIKIHSHTLFKTHTHTTANDNVLNCVCNTFSNEIHRTNLRKSFVVQTVQYDVFYIS